MRIALADRAGGGGNLLDVASVLTVLGHRAGRMGARARHLHRTARACLARKTRQSEARQGREQQHDNKTSQSATMNHDVWINA